MADAWESIFGVRNGTEPQTGTYSIDMDGMRFPSMVPGNTQWLTPAIKMGMMPSLSLDQAMRALAYALSTGNFKDSKESMSPLGSGFDFYNPSSAKLWDMKRLGYSINSEP